MDLLNLPLRGLIAAALLISCKGEPPASEVPLAQGRSYLSSPRARRAALEQSLVNPENGYSHHRLENYTEEGWGALPVWNPRVRPVRSGDIGRPVPRPGPGWRTLELDSVPWTEGGLRALGEEVFSNFPVQIGPFLREALDTPDGPERYGLWRRGDRIGGLVWVDLPGGVEPAMTCSSCHASAHRSEQVVPGLANSAFDLGRMMDDFYGVVSANRRWGPGRVDITPDGLENPTAIADLRPLRYQTHIHRTASVRNSLLGLSLRIETGMITATGGVVRPPRKAVFAMASYLWSLGETLPMLGQGSGRAVFDRECARCHVPPALSGPPTPISEVGTNPLVVESPIRRTGAFQTPSLRGVSDRARLFSDGAVRDLRALIDPSRRAPGHPYGFDLSDDERRDLLSLLEGL